MKSIAIQIQGRVQGVGFRYNAKQVAIANNISGIVKNMRDGSVYIEASGSDEEIEQFVNWCHNGPKWAYVEKVDVSEINNKGHIGFTVK